MLELETKEQVAQAYFIHNMLGKALKKKGIPTIEAGDNIDLSGTEVMITIHPNSNITRSEGKDGTGIEWKAATQKLYGWAMIYAIVHHLSRYLAKFKLQDKAEKLMLGLIRRIVKLALESEVTSEEAFRELHPRVADGIDEVKEKMKGKLGKIPYPTQRRVAGGIQLTKLENKEAA